MQSSAVVTARAMVMLICLLVVPFLAIFGSSLPQVFHSIVQGRVIPHAASAPTASNDDVRNRGGDAPVYMTPAPSSATEAAAPPWPANAADRTATLWAPPALAIAGRDEAPPANFSAAAVGPNRVMPAAAAVSGPRTTAPPLAARPPESGAEEPFRQIERRLRELGATYCLLETFGNRGQSYRFYCKVSVAGDPHHARPFDATDEDPIRAMRQVLEHVERWRAGAEP